MLNTDKVFTTTKFRSVLAATLFLGLVASTQASTSYQQSPVDGGDAIFANASSGAIIADNFSVGNSFNLESLSWWGSYDTNDSDNFIIHLHADASGLLGTLIHDYSSISVSKTVTALTDISNAPVYRYDFSLPTVVSLTAGNYYLSITNETTASGWYWLNGSGGDAQQWALASDGSTWTVGSTNDLAFMVQYTQTSAVPVPPAFLLMMSGLLVLGRKLRSSDPKR